MQRPSSDHAQFDEICANLDEWVPLPAVTPTPVDEEFDTEEEEQTAPLDELILAGLVAPV